MPPLSSCETLGRLSTLFLLSFFFFSSVSLPVLLLLCSPAPAGSVHTQTALPLLSSSPALFHSPIPRVAGDGATCYPSAPASFTERHCNLLWCALCFDFPCLFCLHPTSPPGSPSTSPELPWHAQQHSDFLLPPSS